MWRLLRYLIGADVFISYARADAGAYAGRLADQLKSEAGVSVYLDQELSPAGRELPALLLRHLKLSRRLVVVVSDAALESVSVRREVEAFAQTPRPMIPIDALDEEKGGRRPSWPGLHGAFWRSERCALVRAGTPSEEVVREILDTIGADRQSRRTQRAAWSTLAAVALTAIVSLIMIVAAQMKRDEAEWRAGDAELKRARARKLEQDATEARRRAQDDLDRAVDARSRAEGARTRAEAAAIRQSRIAEATSMANAAAALLQKPAQLQSAAVLAMASMRRFLDLDERSFAAETVLRDALAHLGTIERRIVFSRRAEKVRVSQYGDFIAAAHGSTIELWGVASGRKRVLSVGGPGDAIPAVLEFSDDEAYLAAAFTSGDGESTLTRIWHTADGRPVAPALQQNGSLQTMAISADGRFFATWIDDVVQVWSAATNEPAGVALQHDRIEPRARHAAKLTFSKSARLLGASGPTVRIWDWKSGASPIFMRSSPERYKPSFTDDEQTVVLSSAPDSTIAVRIRDDSQIWTAEGWLTDLSPWLAAIRSENAIELRDVASGDVLDRVPTDAPSFAFIGRDRIGVISADQSVRIYGDVDYDEVARVGHSGGAEDMGLLDSGRIVSAGYDEALVWDAVPAEPLSLLSEEKKCVYASDSNRIALVDGVRNPVIRIFDGATHKVLSSSAPLRGFAGQPVFDGSTVAVGGSDGRAYAWQWRHGRIPTPLLPRLDGPVSAMAISPSGRLVAAASGNEVVVWSLRQPSAPVTRIHVPAKVSAIAFGTSDRHLATVSQDGRLRLWQRTSHSGVVTASVPAPGASSLIHAGDGTLAVDGAHGVDIRRLDSLEKVDHIDHGDLVLDVATAEGGLVATAGFDGLVRVWRRNAGAPATELSRIRFGAIGRSPYSMSLSHDGRFLATGHLSGLQVRMLDPRDLLPAACASLRNAASDLPDYQAACAKR